MGNTLNVNPASRGIMRAGVSRKRYLSRPSQISRGRPGARLLARRKANLRHARAGYFPNPGKRGGRFDEPKMRDVPLSDYEKYLARRLREMDPERLEKLVPEWAKTSAFGRGRRFVPGAPPAYPSWAKSTALAPEKRKFPRGIKDESAKDYAARYEMANMLKFKSNPGGVRIVHNRLLGGWYIVRGPHQTPLSGRFDSKEEAKQSLIDAQNARDSASARLDRHYRRNPGGAGREIFLQVREGSAWVTNETFPHSAVGVAQAKLKGHRLANLTRKQVRLFVPTPRRKK